MFGSESERCRATGCYQLSLTSAATTPRLLHFSYQQKYFPQPSTLLAGLGPWAQVRRLRNEQGTVWQLANVNKAMFSHLRRQ